MNLERTKRLLNSEPDTSDPLRLLVEVLAATIELLSLEGNDYSWSSWSTREEALGEVEPMLRLAESGVAPDHGAVCLLYFATGPLQEVAISSGWGEAFIKLAERYDAAEDLLWPPRQAGG